jgi:outer membrane receptor protein involved in Fe transport
MRKLLVASLLLIITVQAYAQTIKGTVKDLKSKELLIGATVSVKGTQNGTTTDLDGKFALEVKDLPVTLLVTYIGYQNKELIVTDAATPLLIQLGMNESTLKEATVVESRLTEKQRESALTVEAMDILAIKETPAANFYDGLGALKGVDVTAASLGFKVVNTRGFNSTSPVRTLQIIDGVDNQAPGLNFSLGNFLGTSELDLLKVDLVVGASSAFYGPNAFNGVISMTTRSPFVKPGLEVSVKSGSRDLLETALRYAFVVKNKAGEDKLGMKFNASVFRAYDWEADNRAATPQSVSNEKNPGGYDAVNVYGDEYNSGGDFSLVPAIFPGLGVIHRTGYAEKDIVDYNTRNIKLNTALHYKFTKDVEFIASSNFSTGTTVYQGDNRYSLKDILFFQNRLELRKPDKFFLRAYVTNENAGNSYDAYFTALLLQRSVKSDIDWNDDYVNYLVSNNVFNEFKNYPGFPKPSNFPVYTDYLAAINPFLLTNYYDSLTLYHGQAAAYANSVGSPLNQNAAMLMPGTYAFDSALAAITSRETFSQGGSKFYDKSALYHVHGEYKFDIKSFKFTTGANFRQYLPNSRGTIFSDTGTVVIRNSEFGVYAGVEKKIVQEKLKLSATVRMDKNENFDLLVSPAFSGVYTPDDKNTFRVSFSSAIRNPTLADQYLYYRVGRAVLIGNLNGFDSLVTLPSLFNGLNYQNIDTLDYFNVNPVRPEQVRTIEAGYRTTLFDRLFIDMNGYYSVYTDFIGYKLGADLDIQPFQPLPITLNNIYRVATNSADVVTTRGFTIGANYYFSRFYTVSGNWSWNELDRRGSDDPLIPAFNTPRNKFNLGLAGSQIDNFIGSNWGFNINYKWVKGFLFEGSPQFTGEIEDYGLVDAQISKRFTDVKTTLKVGCSNILNNLHYEVYGGPLIGRLLYLQLLVELN